MRYRTPAQSRRRFVLGTAGLATAASFAPLRVLGQDATPGATPEAVAVEAPDMTGAAHAFSVGSFTCWSVSDGANTGPFTGALAFGGMEEAEAEVIIQEAGVDPSQFVAHHTSTVIDTGSEIILVDTGAGRSGLPEAGILIDNLRRIGIQPNAIDVVVLTHGHPDHVGGNLTATGNPLYTNARYVMAQEEWDFWTDAERVRAEAPADLVDTFLENVEANLVPLDGTIELIGYDEEIVPGVTSVDARGHTPGHMALRVESDGDTLWVMGDAALNAVQISFPEAIGLPDTYPDEVVATRERLFAEIADSGAQAVFNHFDPFPSLGEIVSEGDTWAWQPVEVATGEEDA